MQRFRKKIDRGTHAQEQTTSRREYEMQYPLRHCPSRQDTDELTRLDKLAAGVLWKHCNAGAIEHRLANNRERPGRKSRLVSDVHGYTGVID